MFDGNYKAKRSINLSKSTRNKQNASRSSIIQQSKEQREKRLLQTKRFNAAKIIQRVYRGYKCRIAVVHWLLDTNDDDECLVVEKLGGLFMEALIPFVDNVRMVVVRLAKYVHVHVHVHMQSLSFEVKEERYILYRRIVIQALLALQQHAFVIDSENQLLLHLISTIFASNATMNKIINAASPRNGASSSNGVHMSRVEVELITTLKNWLWNTDTDTSTNTNTDAHSCTTHAIISTELMKLAHHMEQLNSHNSFKGCLAAVIFGVDMDRSKRLGLQSASKADEMEWFFSLFETMVCAMMDTTTATTTNMSNPSDAIVNIMAGREVIYLKNALEILSSSSTKVQNDKGKFTSLRLSVIQFMSRLFDPMIGGASMQLHALVILSGLAAKGVDVLNAGNVEVVDLTGDDDDDDDEEEDAEMEDAPEPTTIVSIGTSATSITTARTNRSASSRKMRRQDLQTTTKLDQLYKTKQSQAQNEVFNWLQGVDSHTSQTLRNIAKGIGGGDLILQLAPAVFQIKSELHANDSRVQGILYNVLSVVLQNCTGVKARDSAMSPLLSKLAFNPTFLEELWSFARYQLQSLSSAIVQKSQEAIKAYSAITLFCDLFSHQLLALDDEEFISSFTEMNPSGKAKSRILAVDLVDTMNGLLYDLYWHKPVVADDYFVPSSSTSCVLNYESIEKYHRARLLLSGTKLWNALYARWSRLLRTAKFCDEQLWCFPHLVTRDQDEKGAVDPRVAAAAAMNEDMEDDNDSVDSAMELDHNVIAEADNENEALASSFKDPKMARILTSIPQALPFDRRAKLFSSLLYADILKTQDETAAMQAMMWNMQRGVEGAEFTGREKAKIRRDELYNDSMDQLNKLGRRLKKKIQVTFISQHGQAEAGIDGGGLFKEFLDDLMKDAFDPEAIRDGLGGPIFVESSLQTLAVNARLKASHATLVHYQFLGRVLGKAVYESILVEPQFCLPFLNQLLGQHNTIDDLKNVDPVYYKHLSALHKMSSQEIESLELTFELTAPSEDGKSSHTVELIPGGSSTRVTKENVIRYVHLVAHRRLNMETAAQTNAFLHGFRDLIPASWVRLFSPYELQKVISGDDTVKGFDVKSLKNAMEYGGGYHPSQPLMIWFWEVIEEMTASQKSKFLKFVTSCSRQPLLGFRTLSPLPCIHQVRLREDEENLSVKELRLPTSATCMNLLKLPDYKSKEVLRAKLLYAIESGAGFELS